MPLFADSDPAMIYEHFYQLIIFSMHIVHSKASCVEMRMRAHMPVCILHTHTHTHRQWTESEGLYFCVCVCVFRGEWGSSQSLFS